MKNIQVSTGDLRQLEWLCKNWYVIKGAKPFPLEKAISKLINEEYDRANPHQYQTTGFDRQ